MSEFFFYVSLMRVACGEFEWLGFASKVFADDSNEAAMNLSDLICGEYAGWEFTYCTISRLAYEQQKVVDLNRACELLEMKAVRGGYI